MNITRTLQVERHKKKGCNGQEVHASTLVEKEKQGTIRINYDNTPIKTRQRRNKNDVIWAALRL